MNNFKSFIWWPLEIEKGHLLNSVTNIQKCHQYRVTNITLPLNIVRNWIKKLVLIMQDVGLYGKGPGMFSDSKIMDMATKLKFELRLVMISFWGFGTQNWYQKLTFSLLHSQYQQKSFSWTVMKSRMTLLYCCWLGIHCRCLRTKNWSCTGLYTCIFTKNILIGYY